MNVGYFNIPYKRRQKGFIDWKWLRTQKVVQKTGFCVHARSKKNLRIVMDGKNGTSVIYK